MDKSWPMLIALVVAIIVIVPFFFNIGFLSVAEKQVQDWGIIIAAFALVLASINLAQVNIRAASRGGGLDKICSIVLLASMAVMAVIGLSKGQTNTVYATLFDGIITPGGSTVWAIGVFYIASAAYRAFRVRNVDAWLLLVSSAFVMLGAVPIGEAMWSQIPAISDWIMDVPNMAAMRGMLIGAGVGAFSGSLRALLGIERRYGN